MTPWVHPNLNPGRVAHGLISASLGLLRRGRNPLTTHDGNRGLVCVASGNLHRCRRHNAKLNVRRDGGRLIANRRACVEALPLRLMHGNNPSVLLGVGRDIQTQANQIATLQGFRRNADLGDLAWVGKLKGADDLLPCRRLRNLLVGQNRLALVHKSLVLLARGRTFTHATSRRFKRQVTISHSRRQRLSLNNRRTLFQRSATLLGLGQNVCRCREAVTRQTTLHPAEEVTGEGDEPLERRDERSNFLPPVRSINQRPKGICLRFLDRKRRITKALNQSVVVRNLLPRNLQGHQPALDRRLKVRDLHVFFEELIDAVSKVRIVAAEVRLKHMECFMRRRLTQHGQHVFSKRKFDEAGQAVRGINHATLSRITNLGSTRSTGLLVVNDDVLKEADAVVCLLGQRLCQSLANHERLINLIGVHRAVPEKILKGVRNQTALPPHSAQFSQILVDDLARLVLVRRSLFGLRCGLCFSRSDPASREHRSLPRVTGSNSGFLWRDAALTTNQIGVGGLRLGFLNKRLEALPNRALAGDLVQVVVGEKLNEFPFQGRDRVKHILRS